MKNDIINKLTFTGTITGIALMLFTGTAISFWLFSISFVVGMVNIVYHDIKSWKSNTI